MKRGFTLLEVAIALVIIGILGGLTIPFLRSFQERKSSQEVTEDLLTLKRRIIAYYQSYGRIPAHTPDFELNSTQLQVPAKFLKDPITGLPYRYVADTSLTTNTIYVDGNSLGRISAVIISAGRNGKFDGENATPADLIFQSTGIGDFDDILISVSEWELRQEQGDTICTSYEIRVTNNYGGTISVWPLRSQSSATPVTGGSTRIFTNILPFEQILIFWGTSFSNTSYTYLIPSKFDKNRNCIISINVNIITLITNVPVITDDQN